MIKKNAADLQHTFFQILVAMLMVFVLLICAASPAHAVVGVTSILIPSVIAALESWGISTAADGLDGDEIAEWFHEKLTSWETAAQISLANIVTGIKMTPIGQVLLNPIALAGIREFGAWLVQQEGLVAGGSPAEVLSSSYHAFGYTMYPEFSAVTTGAYDFEYLPSAGVYYFVEKYNSSMYSVYAVSLSAASIRIRVTRHSDGAHWYETQTLRKWGNTNPYYQWNGTLAIQGTVMTIPAYPNRISQSLQSSQNTSVSSTGSLALVPSAEMAVPTTSEIQDWEMLINTTLDVGADAAAWYEQVMNKVAANDMTATGTLVDAGTITADQVIDQGAITEQEGVVSWPDVTVPIGVSGLDEIFPFCIPFDVYHFFQALAADPVAPSFEIPFVIPNIVDYTFELDLSDFDQVAQILRTVELLAFCVGLAFVTRSFFIRG